VDIESVAILRSILFEMLQDLSLKSTLLFQFLLVLCTAALLWHRGLAGLPFRGGNSTKGY